MSGIYGDMLLAFPEQQTSITVYDMTPKVNGGWNEVTGSSQSVLGIYQHTTGKRIQDSNGNLVQTSGLEFWTSVGGLAGKFTKIEDLVYRLNSDNNWNKEAGFYRYGLEKVVGNNGFEPNNTTWNPGTNNFG